MKSRGVSTQHKRTGAIIGALMGQFQMADEQVVDVKEAGATPAPAPDVTAAPDAAAPTPEGQPEPQKVFTQEELDAAIGKRLAKEQRKWEREQAALAAAQPKPAATPAPAADGTEPDSETDPLVLAERIANQREHARHVSKVVEAYQEREELARDKYDDFEDVAYNPRLPVTEAMAVTIRESEVGPEILYYLGNNPAEAKRIAQLSPLSQAKEIGKIETKLASDPPAKKTSSAPAPIAPVSGRAAAAPVHDTTDPRSIQSMDTSTWIAKERERVRRKLESQHSR